MELPDLLDLLLKAVGLIAASAFSLYQARNLLPGARSRLKTDLEILKLIDASHPLYAAVQDQADAGLRQVYAAAGESAWGRRVYSSRDFIAGLIIAVGSGVWTAYLVTDGFNGWAVVTGFFMIAGVGGVLTGLDPGERGRPTGSSS